MENVLTIELSGRCAPAREAPRLSLESVVFWTRRMRRSGRVSRSPARSRAAPRISRLRSWAPSRLRLSGLRAHLQSCALSTEVRWVQNTTQVPQRGGAPQDAPKSFCLRCNHSDAPRRGSSGHELDAARGARREGRCARGDARGARREGRGARCDA
jgi:hypothetical protein